jgi:hypothetical protein
VDADELPGKPPPSMEEVAVAGRVVGAAIDPLPRPRARGGGGSPTPRGLGPREWDDGVERPPRPNRRPATAAAAHRRRDLGFGLEPPPSHLWPVIRSSFALRQAWTSHRTALGKKGKLARRGRGSAGSAGDAAGDGASLLEYIW